MKNGATDKVLRILSGICFIITSCLLSYFFISDFIIEANGSALQLVAYYVTPIIPIIIILTMAIKIMKNRLNFVLVALIIVVIYNLLAIVTEYTRPAGIYLCQVPSYYSVIPCILLVIVYSKLFKKDSKGVSCIVNVVITCLYFLYTIIFVMLKWIYSPLSYYFTSDLPVAIFSVGLLILAIECIRMAKQSKNITTDNIVIAKSNILTEYKQLLDDGIITQEEFEAKKSELLQ